MASKKTEADGLRFLHTYTRCISAARRQPANISSCIQAEKLCCANRCLYFFISRGIRNDGRRERNHRKVSSAAHLPERRKRIHTQLRKGGGGPCPDTSPPGDTAAAGGQTFDKYGIPRLLIEFVGVDSGEKNKAIRHISRASVSERSTSFLLHL